MDRKQLLDMYFLTARASLLDLAAFLDRVERADGESDYRLAALKEAIGQLNRTDAKRTEHVLLSLSDPTTELVERAPGKGASGAWDGKK